MIWRLNDSLLWITALRADSMFQPSQWETALLCNDVSHWLGANLWSTSSIYFNKTQKLSHCDKFLVGENIRFDKPDWPYVDAYIMTSSNGNIFRVTSPLHGEFTGCRWIPITEARDAELWCFCWSTPEWTVDWTIVRLVIRDAMAFIMTSL